MKIKTFVLCGALLYPIIVSAIQTVLANGDNLLRDASFEQQLAPGKAGWILFDQSRFSPDQARSGSQSMFNWGFSRTVPSPPFLLGTVSGSYQEFPANPGSRWRLTGYGFTPTALRGVPAFGLVQVSFFDDLGNDLGTVETSNSNTPKAKTSNQLNSQTPVGKWVLLDIDVATAPSSTTKVQAFTLYVDYSGSDIAQGVYFDDLRLCTLDADKNEGSACK